MVEKKGSECPPGHTVQIIVLHPSLLLQRWLLLLLLLSVHTYYYRVSYFLGCGCGCCTHSLFSHSHSQWHIAATTLSKTLRANRAAAPALAAFYLLWAAHYVNELAGKCFLFHTFTCYYLPQISALSPFQMNSSIGYLFEWIINSVQWISENRGCA